MKRAAIILAGGKGERLRPLTNTIPKPLIPVQGKPVLEHLFDLFKKYNVTDIILSVGYLKEKIKEYVGDGTRFGLRVSYVEEHEPLGTGGPLKILHDEGRLPAESFFVSNGDELKDLDLDSMLEAHKENNATATIALTPVSNPSDYGVAKIDGQSILEFVEKPSNPPSNLINSGFYVVEPQAILQLPKGSSMLEKDLFPKVAQQKKLFGYHFKGQWFDTGTFERYEKAKQEWRGISSKINVTS